MRRALLSLLFLASLAFGDLSAEEKASPPLGSVRIPLAEYDALVRAAGRLPAELRPVEAAFVRTEFLLTGLAESATLRSTLEVVSLSDRPQALPLPDVGSIFSVEPTHGGASLIADSSGKTSVRLLPRSHATLTLRSVPTRREQNGAVTVSWSVPDSPSNRLEASLPSRYTDVNLESGTGSVTADRGEPVRVEGTLDGGRTVRLTYAAQAPAAPEEKLVASASESRLYRLGHDALSIASRVRIEVLRGALREVEVEAPADLRVLSAAAAGNTVTSFDRDAARPERLRLRLGNPVSSGSIELFWLLAREGKVPEGEWELPEVALPDLLRGEVAIAVVSARPLLLAESKERRDGYERIDESDLPSELLELTDSPVLYAARRVGTKKPRLSLAVSSFPESAGLAGVIDRARLLTVVTPNGKRIDRWRLELQTREPLLRVPLPEGEIWSALLDGKAFRPLREGSDLLVPMGRGAASLGSRVLEIVVAASSATQLPRRGEATFELPRLPFPATAVLWDLFLPEKAQYQVTRGTVAEPPRENAEQAETAGLSGEALGGIGAPSGAGQLTGRVVDRSGNALPGVNVILSGGRTPWRRNAVTDSSGSFRFADLPEGRARLRAELSGFNSAEQPLDVHAGANLTTTLPLSPATVQDAVTVTGEAPIVDVTKSESSLVYRLDEEKRTGKRPSAVRPLLSQRDILTEEERVSLQRTTQEGVATIRVDLPETGKRLELAGYLLVGQAPEVGLRVRPARKGWLW